MMDAQTLAQAFKATIAATGDATAWTADPRNARKLAQDRGRHRAHPARSGMEARPSGADASRRPTCVGVFGPSQAGKSYLVSVLARKAARRR